LILTCNDAMEGTYYVTLYPEQFSTFTYTTLSNCNFQANWVINVRGTDNVTFSGDSFPSVPGAAIYNVIGEGRTISVIGTFLNGHLLAPDNYLYQPETTIAGKVVVGDVFMSRQINKQNNCPNPGNVTISVPVSGTPTPDTSSSSSGSDSGSSSTGSSSGTNVPLAAFASFAPGDQVHVDGGNQYATIIKLNNNGAQASITIDQALTFAAGDKLVATVSNIDSRYTTYNAPSSAVAMSVSVLIVILALLF